MKNDSLKETLQSRFKEIDSATISGLVRTYCYCLMSLAIPVALLGGLIGLLTLSIISIPLAFVISSITDKISNRWSRLFYAGRKPTWTLQEKFQGNLDQVMFLKRQKQFSKALQKINEILNEESDFSEALFLKAQILWEGYESANGARRYLNMAKDFSSPEGHLYRWICSYQDNINETVKKNDFIEKKPPMDG